MADYTLSVEVTGDVTKMQKAFEQAQESAKGLKEKVGNSFNFSEAMTTAGDNLKAFGSKMSSIGSNIQAIGLKMSLGLTLPIIAAGKQLVTAASDYQENLNKVDVAFGKSSESVKKFASTATTQFGLSKNAALDAAALFGDMGTSMGLPQAEAAKMATSLTGLAGDMASFKNIGVEQAMTALNGVFTGETESLKTLGIVMTDANLNAYALEKGFGKTTDQMTQSEKVALRYAYVMDATKNAQGDYARTSDGTANSMRTFQSELSNLAAELGQNLLPVITPIIRKMTELVKAFGKMSPETQKLILGIAAFVAAAGPVAVVIGTITKTIGIIISSIGGLIGSFGTISTVVSSIWTVVSTVFTAIVGAIGWPVTTILALIGFFALLYAKFEPFREFVNGIVSSIAEFFSGVWTTITTNATTAFTNIVTAVSLGIEGIKAVASVIGGFFSDIWNGIEAVAVGVWNGITSFITGAINGIIGVVGTISGAFSAVFNGLKGIASGAMNGVESVVVGVFNAIKGAWNGLTGFVQGVFNGISSAVQSLVSSVKGFVNDVIGGINSAISIINKIPGVSIGAIPQLARGTQNWQGGFARMNEGGRGELTYLPGGSVVVPHDISMKYARESARANAPVVVTSGADDLAYRALKVAQDASKRPVVLNVNGKSFAKTAGNDIVSYQNSQETSLKRLRGEI